MAGNSDSFTDGLQATWKTLALVASWVVAIVGNFVLVPPFQLGPDAEGKLNNPLVYFSTVLVTIFVGLAIMPARRIRTEASLHTWRRVALASLVVAVISLAVYITYYSNTVLKCADCPSKGRSREMICGTADGLQKEAASYLNTPQNGGKSLCDCQVLRDDFGCEPTNVWTRESINAVWRRLAVGYVTCSLLWSICILSVALVATRKIDGEEPAPLPPKPTAG